MVSTKQSAFLTLYEPVHERFEKYCRASAYGGYPYEDLMNDCLLKAYDKLDVLEDPQAFLSFLMVGETSMSRAQSLNSEVASAMICST